MLASRRKRPHILTAVVLSVFVCQQSPAPPVSGRGSPTNRTINNTVVQPDPAAAARLQFEQAQARAAAAEARRRALAEAAALRRQALEKAQRAIEMFQQGLSPKTEQLAIEPQFRFSVFNLDPKTRQSSSPSPSPTGTPSGTPPAGGRGIRHPTASKPTGGLTDSDAPPTDTFTAPSYDISNPTDIPRVMDVVRTRGRWVTAFGALAQGVTGPIQMTAFTTSVFPASLLHLNGQQFAGPMFRLDESSNPILLQSEKDNITLASAIQKLAVPVGLAQPGDGVFTGPAFDAVNRHLHQALSETPPQEQITTAQANFDSPPMEAEARARHEAVVAALPKGNDGRPIFDRVQAAEGVFVNKIKESVNQTNALIKETMSVLREAKTMADEAAEKAANALLGQAPSSPTPNTANNGQPNSGDNSGTPSDSGQQSPGGEQGEDGGGLQAGNVPAPGALPDGRALADLAGQPPVVPQLDPALTASLNQPPGQPLIFNPVGNPVAAQIQPIRPDGNVQALAPTSRNQPAVAQRPSNPIAGNFGPAGPVAPLQNGDSGTNTGGNGETGAGTTFGPGTQGGTASLDGNYGEGIGPNFGARAGLDNPQKGPPYGSPGGGPGSDPSGGTIATGVDGLPAGLQNQVLASKSGRDSKGRGGLIGQMEDGLIRQICRNTDQRKLAADFCDNITSVAARESMKSPSALESMNRTPAGIQGTF